MSQTLQLSSYFGETDRGELHQVLIFRVGSDTFGVDVRRVLEILDLVPVTMVPGAPSYAPGLINVRGKVVPLVDLRIRLGLPPKKTGRPGRIVVIEAPLGEETLNLALDADEVLDLVPIDDGRVVEMPRHGTHWDRSDIFGITQTSHGLTVLINLAALFGADSAEDPSQLESMTAGTTGTAT